MITFDTHEESFGCNHLGCITLMPIASCIPFPFSTPCDAMLTILGATRWLYMHLYALAYMSMHESCLLVCRLYFNTMKLWTPNPNLHLSLANTTSFLLACLFAFLLVCFLSCLFAISLVYSHPCFYVYHIYHVYLLHASIMCSLHLFLPLLACWFLVFVFACTHMKQGRMELRQGFSSACKKGANASMSI